MRQITPFIAVLQPFATLDGQMLSWQLSYPGGDLDFELPLALLGVYHQVGGGSPTLLVPYVDYTVADQGTIVLAQTYANGDMLLWSGNGSYLNVTAEPTYMRQYATSPVITAMIEDFNEWLDPSADLDNFYFYVWNVLTAVGFGLDIWGRIVGVPRTITIVPEPDYFGFEEALPGSFPFNQQPFYAGPQAGTLYALTDLAYRVLILTKALANICAFTAPAINALLAFMFPGRGSCYVLDLGGMAIEYVFNFTLEPWEASVLLQASLMPRPAGVAVTISNP